MKQMMTGLMRLMGSTARLPACMRKVRACTHDSRHGYGSCELVVKFRADES